MTAPVLDATPATNGRQGPGAPPREAVKGRRGQADRILVRHRTYDELVIEAVAACDRGIDTANRIQLDIAEGSFEAASGRAHRLVLRLGTARREIRRLNAVATT